MPLAERPRRGGSGPGGTGQGRTRKLGAIPTGTARAANPTVSAVYGVYVYEIVVFLGENRIFVDVDNVDAADSVDADSVDAAKTESPMPAPAASTVYEIPAKPAVYEIPKKPEESGVFVDVDNVDDSSRPYPGGRLFPEPQQLPD